MLIKSLHNYDEFQHKGIAREKSRARWSREDESWEGIWGGASAKNQDFNNVLSVFSSFHKII